MTDWQGRAKREAVAIISEALANPASVEYETLLTLVAIGWLQGVNVGSHATLAEAEIAFSNVRDSL